MKETLYHLHLKKKGEGKKNHRYLYWLYTNDLHVLYNLMEDIRGRERSIVGGGGRGEGEKKISREFFGDYPHNLLI